MTAQVPVCVAKGVEGGVQAKVRRRRQTRCPELRLDQLPQCAFQTLDERTRHEVTDAEKAVFLEHRSGIRVDPIDDERRFAHGHATQARRRTAENIFGGGAVRNATGSVRRRFQILVNGTSIPNLRHA